MRHRTSDVALLCRLCVLVVAVSGSVPAEAEPKGRRRGAPGRSSAQSRPTRAAVAAFQSPGTVRMARRLEVIAETTDPWTNPYVNGRRVAALRRVPSPPDEVGRARADYRIAFELFLAGESEEALETFVALLPRTSGTNRIALRQIIAATHLRLGEQRNCIAQHGPESCILPIQGTGNRTCGLLRPSDN